MQVKFSNLPAQYEGVKAEIDSGFEDITRTGAFIGGPSVESFEKDFAAYIGVEHCIGVANGTDALEIILEGSLRPGSVVGVPANTFIATAEAVVRAGHKLYLLDVDETYNLSLASVNRALNDNALDAIVLVHLYGRPVESHIISKLEAAGIAIFEDCAQAHGAKVEGIQAGALGQASAFSFFPGKNLGAFGDAGAICTSDGELAEKFRRLKNHGRLSKFDHDIVGRNSRMDAIQAVVLGAKLRLLDGWNHRRRANAQIYKELLGGLHTVKLQSEYNESLIHVYHHFVVRTMARDGLRDFLTSNGIESGIHYPQTIAQIGAFRGRALGPLPVTANSFSSQILSLPVAEHLGRREIEYVCHKVIQFESEEA